MAGAASDFTQYKDSQKYSFFELKLSVMCLHLLRYALSNSNRNFQKSQVTCWSKAGLEVVIWGDLAGEDHQEEAEVVPLNHALLFIFVRHWNKVCCVVSGLLQIFYTPFSPRYEPFRATHEREFSCPLNFNFHIAGGLQLHFVSVYQLVRPVQVKDWLSIETIWKWSSDQ